MARGDPSGRDMNRRQLFERRRLAEAAGQVLAVADAINEAIDEPSHEDVALIRLGWRAMATTWHLLLPFGNESAMDLAREAFALLDELEDQLTVYRDHSEVSLLNQRASQSPVPVEPRLFDLLRQARTLHGATGGAFDIATGALLKTWGIFKGPRRWPTDHERQEALDRSGMKQVILDEDQPSVRFLRPGVEINLGSIGKGYALDRMVEFLAGTGQVSSALLHGGSSSLYALGDAQPGARGWKVRIRHPWRPGQHLAEIRLRDRAMATSAATFQHFIHKGRRFGHILDPRDGLPAAGVASATVLASSGAVADALSTAFYVGGEDLARSYCESHGDVAVVILGEGKREPTVLNLPSSDYTLK